MVRWGCCRSLTHAPVRSAPNINPSSSASNYSAVVPRDKNGKESVSQSP